MKQEAAGNREKLPPQTRRSNEVNEPGACAAARGNGGVHEAVSEAARRHPGRVAVTDADGALSYAQLDWYADAMAQHLVDKGVQEGDRVLLWARKSCSVVIAMQAVLRIGAVYVPLDGALPAGRVALVARDCAAVMVCTTSERAGGLAPWLEDTVGLADIEEPADSAARLPYYRAQQNDLAFILYTSGSTGRPKGVAISHGNVRAFVDWAAHELAITCDDRLSNHAPFGFDLSVLDLYGALCTGASVHLIGAESAYAPEQLVEFLHDRRISVWYSVPSVLQLMIRAGGLLDRDAPAALRAVLFAGEAFPITGVRELARWTDARLLNLYGPTETNVCTAHEVCVDDLARDAPVPIGSAVSGDHVWARTEGRIAEPGEVGELYVEGPSVMYGYWGRTPHRGAYATGDFARVRPDGSFDLLGRRDSMVKVRGHRVELGAVETALTSHPDVETAVAVCRGAGLDSAIDVFVLPRRGASPSALGLKRHCARTLPPYLIADGVHIVSGLPRTTNGKIDRAALVRSATREAASDPVRMSGRADQRERSTTDA